MKLFNLKIVARNANTLGELLRNQFFKDNSWDFRDDVECDDIYIKGDIHVFRGHKLIEDVWVTCSWDWDDNYSLKFHIAGNYEDLANFDAKKEFGWKFI